MTDRLLRRIDAFLDATVRDSTDAIDVGPLRVFLSRRPWPYYARPRPELDLSSADAVTVADVTAAAGALTAAGAPVAFEWIPELVPSMESSVTSLGLVTTTAPVLVRRSGPIAVPAPNAVALRLLTSDDAAVPAAASVVSRAFGSAYVEEHAFIRSRIARGLNVTVVGEVEGEVVGAATLQPIDDVAEVVGVAVLAEHRRRGLGGALTAYLVAEAHRRGIDLVVLSALPDALGVYESLGFEVVATLASAPPDD